MTKVLKLTFNPFQENTYIVYDETGECVIFDPGCFDQAEKEKLRQVISAHQLRPVHLVNTHCHIDHVFGNQYVADTYGLELAIHEREIPVLAAVPMVAEMYGLPQPDPSPEPTIFLREGDFLTFGQSRLEMRFTPGHSPGSLSFYCAAAGFVIAGDALFHESIGRTDLPGGDHATLINAIVTQLMSLPDETVVYAGHMEETTIGHERQHNPFL